MLRSVVALGVLLAVLATACGDADGGRIPSDEKGASTTVNDGTSTSRVPPGSLAPADESVTPLDPSDPPATVPVAPTGPVAAAVADLAVQLNVDPDQIGVVSAEEVTWRDGAAGCPQPGMAYVQVLTNGSRIRLAVDGTVYQYHTRGGGDPFLCRSPEEPVPGSESPGSG